MPPTSPTPGKVYTFTGDQIGQRADTALATGTEVTVREVVDAGTAGAHDDREDSVVIEWVGEGQVILETRFEERAVPVMALAEDGSVLMKDGQPAFVLQTRSIPIHEFGTGPIARAMSISLAQFAADFQEA